MIDVESAFETVIADDVRRRVGDLITLDRRLTRAECVAADVDHAHAALIDLRFGRCAVRFAGL